MGCFPGIQYDEYINQRKGVIYETQSLANSNLLFSIPSLACGSFTTNSVVGSGHIETQMIDVSGFDHVLLEGFGDVYFEQGQNESLSIQTDSNIIPC